MTLVVVFWTEKSSGTVTSGDLAWPVTLNPFVVGSERVLAQHGALRLVVELEVHPIDGEVAPALLSLADEVAAQPGARGLRRNALGGEDVEIAGHACHRSPALEQVEQSA